MKKEAAMSGNVRVRMFGALQAMRREQGLPTSTEADVPPNGVPAREIATRLGLPLERIEGVFCNHVVHGIGYVIHPGDDIAFVPKGTPGPHRFFLGLYAAGREKEDEQ
jgi:hypothetical protein